MKDESDFSLIEQARQGKLEAFESLVHQYATRLYRVVRRVVNDDGEAESLVQEAFFRVWENLARYKNDRSFFPYLVTVALNLSRDLWRKESYFVSEDESLEFFQQHGDEADPASLAERNEELQLLARAVAELPPVYRAVVALRYDAEMSYEEIAAALNLPVNTVRTHLHRAKARLRRILEEKYGLVR